MLIYYQKINMKAGWKYVKLGEVCEILNGFAFKSSNYVTKGIRVVRITNVQKGYVVDEDPRFYPEKEKETLKRFLLNEGDLLISLTGNVGRVGILPKEMLPAALNQRVACLRIKTNIIILPYLFHYLNSDLFEKECIKNSTGAAQLNMSTVWLANQTIPLPSLLEQGEIVAYLDKEFDLIDALREKATQQLQATKDLFQTQLKQLLTPKQGWEEKRLCDVSDYYNGLTYKPTDVNNKGWIVLRSSNIKNNKLDLSDLVRVNIPIKDRLKVKKGDIIMCSRNGSKSLIGKVALIPENREDLTFGAFMMIFKSQISNYLFYYFLSEQFKKQIWKGEATMINQITRYMLDDVTISLPSLSEQEEIVRKLDALSEQCRQLEENYRQTISLCNDLKQAVLRQVFE